MKAKVMVNCVHLGVVTTGLTRDKDQFFTGTDGIEESTLWTESKAMVGGIWSSVKYSIRPS
ncbi:hypothetical protein ZOSMA_1G03010 [Zostera marina]|uniref:Uncharacterized protein n=1 Tax=Zostera marina TaxID=29655 RepID=A0A0K9PQ06_ZOSMR|nr:hypothetical protein ZOSMA_1G03010 [Zostera marina]